MNVVLTGSSMVSIQIKKTGDLDKDWPNIPVSSYLPVFLSGEQNVENIQKRIEQVYFKKSLDVLEIRWCFRDQVKDGYILKSPFLS